MAGEASDRTLEINEHSSFQRRQLLVARIAVGVFVVVIALGLLGFFGSGPFSYATAGESGDALSVRYQRFLRLEHRTDLELRLSGRQGATTVSFDRSYLDGFEVGRVLPEPDGQSAQGGRLAFTFEDRAPSTLTMSLTPRAIGLHRGQVSVDGHGAVSLRQFVYP